MLKRLLMCAALVLAVGVGTQAWAQETNQTAASAQQTRVIGEVLTVNTAAGEVTIKTDDGRSVSIKLEERASLLRFPQGVTDASRAVKIKLTEVSVGDRVFARGTLSEDGKTLSARQLVVADKQAVAQTQEAQREDWARRGIGGRIESINPEKKEITLRARGGRGDGGAAAAGVVLDASGSKVKFLRYAPDSAKPADAVPSSFATLRVGDQVRARGERSADGTRFTAEEIISGSFQRAGGTVVSVNPAAREVVIKNEQTGQTQTVIVGQRSMLRRLPADFAQTLGQRGGERGGERGNNPRGSNEQRAPREGQSAGGEGQRRPGGGGGGGRGRNFQDALANLPALAIGDLKKGDVVLITGTADTDPARMTAITLITGDAELIRRFQRSQGRPNRDGQNMSPGLPSDVVGGGTPSGNREQP